MIKIVIRWDGNISKEFFFAFVLEFTGIVELSLEFVLDPNLVVFYWCSVYCWDDGTTLLI